MLLLYKILQLVDACNLCVPGGSVNRAFLALLPELEDLVGNLIIGLFVFGFFEKLFLEFLQFLVDTIRGILLSASDYLCNVLLKQCLVGGLITKERVDSLNYHILQYCYFAFVVCKNLLSLRCIEFIKYRFWAYFLNSSECEPSR